MPRIASPAELVTSMCNLGSLTSAVAHVDMVHVCRSLPALSSTPMVMIAATPAAGDNVPFHGSREANKATMTT